MLVKRVITSQEMSVITGGSGNEPGRPPIPPPPPIQVKLS